MFSYTETSLQKLMVSPICKLEVRNDNGEQWAGHRRVLRKLKLCSMKSLVLLFCNVSIALKTLFCSQASDDQVLRVLKTFRVGKLLKTNMYT